MISTPNFTELAVKLGYTFRTPALLTQALTHRSTQQKYHNERLEFLGDAVLGVLMGEVLYRKFPEATEGQLSHLRMSLIRGETLSTVAESLALGEHLLLGQGERQSGGRSRKSILENVLEAVIGAIYLDSDLATCGQVVMPWFHQQLSRLKLADEIRDPKTILQEYLQAKRLPLPEYQLLEASGALHDQTFRIRCAIGSLQIETEGEGKSRKKAEQDAADAAMKKILEVPDTEPS